MPYTLKKNKFRYKNPETGNYESTDVVSERTFEEYQDELETITTNQEIRIQNAGTTQVNAVTAAGAAASANFPVTADACDTLAADFAATYVPDQAYAVGDYCMYQYKLYICNTAIDANTDHTFVASHWDLITVETAISSAIAAVSTDITELQGAENARVVPIEYSPVLTKGKHIKASDGTVESYTKYACTQNSLFDGYGKIASVEMTDTDYEFQILYYDADGSTSTGAGYHGERDDFATGVHYVPKAGVKIGINVRRVDQTNLSNEDMTAIQAGFKFYAPTDTTLLVAGAAADAKAAGDAIDAAKTEAGDAIDAAKTAVSANIAPAYPTGASSYTKGDYVVKDDVLYRFTNGHSAASEWSDADTIQATVGRDLFNLQNGVNGTLTPIDFSPSLTKARGVNASTGMTFSNSRYCRTGVSDHWVGHGEMVAVALTNPAYEFAVVYYDATQNINTGAGFLGSSGYSKGIQYIPEYAVYIALSIRKPEGETMTDEDLTAITAALKAYAATDKTLTKTGIAADAKTVGESALLYNSTSLTAEDDCNNLNTGFYFKPNNVSVNNGISDDSNFAIIVSLNRTGQSGNRSQLWFDLYNNRMWYRTKGNNTWSPWRQTARMEDIAGTVSNIPTALTAEDDCDNLSTGFYWKSNNLTVLNGEEESGDRGALIVSFRPTAANYYHAQLWFDAYYNRVYFRTKNIGEWQPWRRLARMLDVEKFDQSIQNNALKDGFIYRMSDNPSTIPVGENAIGYDAFIAQTWDTFVTDYSSEVTKTKIGTSSTSETVTDEYDIFKYVFTPRDYEKTVFLSAGCHGDEYEGFWGLYRVMRMIYDGGYKYPNLRNLRTKVRFVVIPTWNPWGLENRVRNCPLGFPANENLNADVTVDDVTYPKFTANEAALIKDIIDTYTDDTLDAKDKFTLWVDLHTDPYSSTHTPPYKKGCYGYAPKDSAENKALYALTIDFRNIIKDELNYTTNFTIYNVTGTSGIVGYGRYRNLPTVIYEVTTEEFATSGSATIMKYAQEWYGNGIANAIAVT